MYSRCEADPDVRGVMYSRCEADPDVRGSRVQQM